MTQRRHHVPIRFPCHFFDSPQRENVTGDVIESLLHRSGQVLHCHIRQIWRVSFGISNKQAESISVRACSKSSESKTRNEERMVGRGSRLLATLVLVPFHRICRSRRKRLRRNREN